MATRKCIREIERERETGVLLNEWRGGEGEFECILVGFASGWEFRWGE